MSYLAKFKGVFEYPSMEVLENALKVIEEEDENPDDFEMNALQAAYFKLDTTKSKFKLRIDFSGFIAASSWYGCHRVLCKMSKNALTGKVKCGFEGDPDEWIKAGHGWD